MLTDYSKLFTIYLPIYIVMYLLCKYCELSTKLVSLLIFFLLTLPVLIFFSTYIYYSIGNNRVLDKYNKKDDCEKANEKNFYSCNVWDSNDNKCYKGMVTEDKDKKIICDPELIKNVPSSVYVISLFIIFANLFFVFMKTDCKFVYF